MDTISKVVLTSIVIFGLFVGLGFLNGFYVYEAYGYEIDKIREHLKLALDTHNVNAKVKYIDDTVASLESWHGNSEWWFPKDGTDIDQTRELLRTVSDDVGEQDDVKDRDGYFVLPHNELVIYLNSEIEKGDDRLLDYKKSALYNIYNNPFHYVWGAVLLTSFILFIISGIAKVEE